jgi:hypothetical protein
MQNLQKVVVQGETQGPFTLPVASRLERLGMTISSKTLIRPKVSDIRLKPNSSRPGTRPEGPLFHRLPLKRIYEMASRLKPD